MKKIALFLAVLFLFSPQLRADPPEIKKSEFEDIRAGYEGHLSSGWLGIQPEEDAFNTVRDMVLGAPAKNSGVIQPGDVIVRINEQEVDSPRVIWQELYDSQDSGRIMLEMKRGEQIYMIPLYAQNRPVSTGWGFY